ncbi:MAG: hypothetical protein ACXW1M_02565, partial [Acidimicrobiia bacterium]
MRRKLAITVVVAMGLVAMSASSAFAADKPVYQGPTMAPSDIAVSLNLLWVVLGACLVIFMQAGFAL